MFLATAVAKKPAPSTTGTLKKSSSTPSTLSPAAQQQATVQTEPIQVCTTDSCRSVIFMRSKPILMRIFDKTLSRDQTRTDRINADYTQILDLSAVRKQNLLESIKLFQFLRECDDFEKWIGEKKKYLETPEPNVQVAKRAFEQFLTDLTASNSRISQVTSHPHTHIPCITVTQ